MPTNSDTKDSPAEKPRPQIDDQFWFDRSRAMVEASTTSRQEAAAKLQGLIGWLWAVYAVATGTKLTITGLPSLHSTLWFVIAAITLIAAYALAVRTQMPTDVKFDPRDPDEIRDVYFAADKKKARWLNATIVTAAIALITLTAALVTTSSIDTRPPGCTLSIIAINGNTYLLIEANEARNTVLRIQENGRTALDRPLMLREPSPRASIPIAPSASRRQAMLSWNVSDDTQLTITKTIPPQK